MTLADAARLLAQARSLDALLPLARAAGLRGPALPLPAAARHALDPHLERARVVAGPPPLHALLADAAGPPLRDTAARLAAHLARTTPHHLWLLALRHTGDQSCAVAAWTLTARATPRLSALRFHPDTVAPSDADTLRTLAARAGGARAGGARAAPASPLLTHAAWLDTLGRTALGARFYRTLERTVAALADSLPPSVSDPAARADLALLTSTRLLFLAFLEAKGWLDADRAFLAHQYDRAMDAGGRFHARTLRPLFFGTLNTPRRHRAPRAQAFGRVPFLNGGLFAPTRLERRHPHAHCGDEPLGDFVHTLLARHRFVAHEDSTSWSEAAVDPEMLGHAFESLMHARDRRTSGAFYTPRALVEHATADALRHTLADPAAVDPLTVDAALAGTPPPAPVARRLLARAATMRVLDPACGSGAFLVHALERLADLLGTCGDPRPLADRRHHVLTHSIFGVDVNPAAVWLCELRLWLSVVVERDTPDPHAVPPLPNLDHNVRVGDALAVPAGHEPLTRHSWGGAPWGGGPWGNVPLGGDARRHAGPSGAGLTTLRTRYASLAGPRKHAAARRLDAAERAHALAAFDRTLDTLRRARADAVCAARARDLFGDRHPPAPAARAHLAALRAAVRTVADRRRAVAAGGALPFGFAWHFADARAAGGFDLVLGNPPWVRPHAVAPAARVALRTHYACARPAAGAAGGPAPPNFGAQVDLAALFTERALALTRPGGVTALLVPAKLWRTLAGAPLRALVLRESTPLALDDWSDAPSAFDAAVYPSLLVARRATPAPGKRTAARGTEVRVHRAGTPAAYASLEPGDLPFDRDAPGAPWLLLPADVRRAVDALRAAGPALGDTGLTRPTLGVKCGVNDAFLVRAAAPADDIDLVAVRRADRAGHVERALLRPVLRGEHLARPRPDHDEHLVWPYDADGRLLPALPPAAAGWLAPWRRQLEERSDLRGGRAPGAPPRAAWWALFRTEGADPRRPRVVWPDVARAPHPRVLPAGDPHVPLNTCYVAAFDDPRDAHAFAALLAAPPVAAWLAALAEPARGGYRRFLAWTVALLPVPRDWPAARARLAPLAATAPPHVLARAAADAYGVSPEALAPLVAWSAGASVPTPAPLLVREPAWSARRRTATPPAGHRP